MFGAKPFGAQQGYGAQAFGGGAPFGGASAFNGAAQSGTAAVQYRPTNTGVNGTNDAGTFHCISAMEPYKMKSLEELRWEDYQANRRPGVAGTPAIAATNGC